MGSNAKQIANLLRQIANLRYEESTREQESKSTNDKVSDKVSDKGLGRR